MCYRFRLPALFRRVCLFLLSASVPLAWTPATAAEWAEKMFETRKHDFGFVARGSKSEFRFKFQNIYKEDVHVAGVRASCGCVSVSVPKTDLKTWETGEIVVDYNTRGFLGKHGATITVTIDRPFFAEVRLYIDGYIRSDVVFDPPLVDLGSVDVGKPSATKRVKVRFSGRGDWTIQDVTSANTNFEVEISKPVRAAGHVEYELSVRLKDGAPPGFIKDRLTLVTNDSSGQRIPLYVEGRVLPALSVSPAALFLGELRPGQQASKTIIVHGKKPFKVATIECDDKSFVFKTDDQAATLHKIPVTFTAPKSPGRITRTIHIKTDTGATAQLQATANILGEQGREAISGP
jgi:hypothetical protein